MYVFEFKTKILGLYINLEINASDKYIEEVKINGNKQKNYNKGRQFLSISDLSRLPQLYRLIGLLDDYFSNKTANFTDIPVNFSLYSPFTQKILNTLRTVQYGEVASYKELAKNAGYTQKYSRACASALSINQTPIILPCHRIITSGGKLGGYSGGGGINFKAKLLALEKIRF